MLDSVDRAAALDVAVARGGMGRRDAEGGDPPRRGFDRYECRAEPLAEELDRLDEMIRREDRKRRARIALREHECEEADRVQRVAPRRFKHCVFRAQFG